ncbi:MAG: IS630 family transposase [Rhodospirillales bacterium 20-64-7]|nr:MAG: IS630 family transposase [Rhodospirillales bacterium 20-64-7]
MNCDDLPGGRVMARIGRPQEQVLTLSEIERDELERLGLSQSASHSVVRRAHIVLASASGEANMSIAKRLGVSNPTICHWRKIWFEKGLTGLYGEAKPGRPRTHDEERIASLLRTVIESKPAGATHWTVRSAAATTGLSKSTVARMLALFNVRPHRSKIFRLSSDPLFVDKVRDIVGLYLNPPDHALVLCVDEKTQVQALERRQPMLPLGLGYIEGVTHDYVRHGTTTLFAALDIANGQVMTQCRARHRYQEFLGFLKHIEANVPSDLDLHLVVDNYAAHKHPKVRVWLAERPRFTLHFTPTYASWMVSIR